MNKPENHYDHFKHLHPLYWPRLTLFDSREQMTEAMRPHRKWFTTMCYSCGGPDAEGYCRLAH